MPRDDRSNTPASQSRYRDEHVTATGWRAVGRAAAIVSESIGRDDLCAGDDANVLYAAKFRLRPRIGNGSVVHDVLGVLGGAIAHVWQDAPPLTRERRVVQPVGRFQGLRWETLDDGGAWTGELIWRHKHPFVAGAPCTTHVVLTEQHAQASLTVRVTADTGVASVRGMVGAGQARPAWLTDINRSLRLTCAGSDCAPHVLPDGDVDDFVRHVLLADDRELPVAVQSPLEDGGFAVPPAEIADELVGLASLIVIERHPTTFRLSDSLGDRRLSCYWGALRVYMPGFSCADRPEDHPLLVRDRLIDPVMRADLRGKLGRHAAVRVSVPVGVDERRRAAAPSAAAAVAPPATPAPAAAPTKSPVPAPAAASPAPVSALPAQELSAIASMPPLLADLGRQLGGLASAIERLMEVNVALVDEIGRLRTTTAVRSASSTSLERRIGGIEDLLTRQLSGNAPDALDTGSCDGAAGHDDVRPDDDEHHEDDEALTLVDVVRQAATSHGDALLVLDAAERAAAESPYTSPDQVAVILDAMASVARRRQEGALGTSLRDAFRELGIDYRGGIASSTPQRQRQQYLVRGPDGQEFDCREHIALGNSYDPRYCLRVYFTSRAPVEPRFVIGHVGRHFTVLSST
ncbi:MAG TPA: hypothetical protein VFG84_02470 [Gemmatimonadaceae bacterium]|nr:hypothetical protein [Gemmatimonadaceae bacterium]